MSGYESGIVTKDYDNKIHNIEKKVDTLAAQVDRIAEAQVNMSKNLDTLTNVLVKLAEQEQIATQNTRSIDELFKQVRQISDSIIPICGAREVKINNIAKDLTNLEIELEKSINFRDKILISISLMFASGLVAMFFEIIRRVK
jgi:ribosome-binding ATPase YchF (GTP1/OBG family)